MKAYVWMCSAVVVVALLVAGCGKDEQQDAADPAELMQQEKAAGVDLQAEEAQAQAAAEAAEEQAQQLKAQAEAEAARLKEEAAAQAEAVKAQAEEQAQALQDKFDAFVADIKAKIEAQKYEVALTELQKALGADQYTEDQKTILQRLIEQVRKAMASDAAGEAKRRIGGALQGLGGN